MSVTGSRPACGEQLVAGTAWLNSGRPARDPLDPFDTPSELLVRLSGGEGGPVMKEGLLAEGSYCLQCGTLVLNASLPHLKTAPGTLRKDEW